MVQQLAKVSKMQTKCGFIIEQYLKECGRQSKSTEDNYKSDIGQFLKEEFEKSIDTITLEEIDLIDYDILMGYREKLIEKVANTTVNRHINSIKSLLRHMKAINSLKSDISYLSLIRALPNRSQKIEHMSRDIVLRYMNEASRELHNGDLKENLIRLAVDTGLRLDELLELKLSNFTIEDDTVLIKGYGKGNKPFTDRISISEYNRHLKTMKTGDNPSSRIFAPLSEKNMTDMMLRFKEVLGYSNRRFSFHSFKKTAVTYAYRLTGDILEAQKKGRHSNLETTRGYLEDQDYGVTGMFSLGDHDDELYKKVEYEELMNSISEMNLDFLHLLNVKLASRQK